VLISWTQSETDGRWHRILPVGDHVYSECGIPFDLTIKRPQLRDAPEIPATVCDVCRQDTSGPK
jgi:hypothetical protein